jgi:hypothetical protein
MVAAEAGLSLSDQLAEPGTGKIAEPQKSKLAFFITWL